MNTNTNTKAKNTKASKRRKRLLKRRTRNKLRKMKNRNNRNRMPAAFTKSYNRFFRIIKQDGNSMQVRGRDLVYAIPETLVSNFQETNVITVIPCNPCYWTGTRISAIANGYQNYRPVKFTVNYIPQCAVTQQGNVISGTIWNQTPSSANLQQTLRTSSGGMLTQCYKTATSVVRMKSNLQYNLFRCAGKFDQESNPFTYISISVGCVNANNEKIIPGYFYVSWEYIFKNPIGFNTTFGNSGLKPLNTIKLDAANTTLVACQEEKDKGISVGQIIQVDKVKNSDDYLFTYNNAQLDLTKESELLVWSFINSPITTNAMNEAIGEEYEIYYQDYIEYTGPIQFVQYSTISYLDGNSIVSWYNSAETRQETLNLPQGSKVYRLLPSDVVKSNLGLPVNLGQYGVIFRIELEPQDEYHYIKSE